MFTLLNGFANHLLLYGTDLRYALELVGRKLSAKTKIFTYVNQMR